MPTTDLHIAAQFGNVARIQELIAKGESVSAVSDSGFTPLLYAAQEGNVDAVKALVAAGSSPLGEVDAVDRMNALHWAAYIPSQGCASVIQALVGLGMDPSTPERRGNAALHICAKNGNTPALSALLASGASPLVINKQQATPLHLVKDAQAVQLLVQAGAPLDAVNEDGETPLHVIAKEGHTAAVKALLAAKPLLEAKSNSGRTPLHVAAYRGQAEVIKLLLKAGADMTSTDVVNGTPLRYAIENGWKEAEKVLKEAGAQ